MAQIILISNMKQPLQIPTQEISNNQKEDLTPSLRNLGIDANTTHTIHIF